MPELLTPQSPFGHRLAVAWQLFWAALRPHRFVRAEVLTPEEAEMAADVAAFDAAMAEWSAEGYQTVDARQVTEELKRTHGWS